MLNIYKLIRDRLGMGADPIETLQEKAKRIAVFSGFIAEKVAEKEPLNMSIDELQVASLITRTVHPDNEGIYNGNEPFDSEKNRHRGDYSLKVAEERGVALSDTQKAVVRGDGGLIEGRIIKLAETIIAVQYRREQNNVEKGAITETSNIMNELMTDNRIDTQLVKEIIGEQELAHLISNEMQVYSKKTKETEKTTEPKKTKNDEVEI